MTNDLKKNIRRTTEKPKRFLTLKILFASFSLAFGCILVITALIIWLLSSFENWSTDILITIMLTTAFVILMSACHYFDCSEKQTITKYSKP